MLHAEKRFRELAKLYNAQLNIHDKDVPLFDGVFSPNLEMKMKVHYGNHEIVIVNKTGRDFNGHTYCKLLFPTMTEPFELYTISHFLTLFVGKKNRFRTSKPNNTNLKSFLLKSSSLRTLKDISNQDVFEPRITGSVQDGNYFLSFDYHLQFDDWLEVIPPIISFYKEFIDSFSSEKQ